MNRVAPRGFTLIELMVTLSVLSILAVVAMPTFHTTISNNRVTAATNTLVGDFHLARSEAIKRGHPVSVCSSSDGETCAGSTDWAVGWIVFTDDLGIAGAIDSSDEVLRVSQSFSGDLTLSGVGTVVRYQADGQLDCSVSATGC